MRSFIAKIGREKNLSSLISNGSVALAGLLSFILLTRQLDKEVFGDWVLFITLATFADLLRFGFTRTAAVRELSGATPGLRKEILGATYRIHIYLVLGIMLVCWPLLAGLQHLHIKASAGYVLFLTWYPLLAMANLGWNNALALFQAEQQFKRMMWVRLSNVVPFLLFLMFNHFFWGFDLLPIVLANIAFNFFSSSWCTLSNWDGLRYLRYASKARERELLHFGKYSMGTLIGSSLLKSADTFIIGLSPFLGSAGIALYAIPLKLTDLLGIPLNSFAMTAYPRMAKACLEGNVRAARHLFYTYSGLVTLGFLPVALAGFIWADAFVLFLGGSEYRAELPLLSSVFRVFALYVILLPTDRFTGVLLDSLNRPRFNLYKVLAMAFANIAFDLLAVFVFKSLVAVAAATVLFTVLGIALGFRFLGREAGVKAGGVFSESLTFIRTLKTLQTR